MDQTTPERDPDEAIRDYLESCRERGLDPKVVQMISKFHRDHGVGVVKALRYIKAFSAQNPGSLPKLASWPLTLFWMALYMAFGAFLLYRAYQAWRSAGELQWLTVVAGLFLLLVAKRQFEFRLLMGRRLAQQSAEKA